MPVVGLQGYVSARAVKVLGDPEGIHGDRIASGWLIRRFIDTAAKLQYVEAKGYAPVPGELRFEMFDAEFTHDRDRALQQGAHK